MSSTVLPTIEDFEEEARQAESVREHHESVLSGKRSEQSLEYERMGRLPRFLRMFGSAALLVAAAVFLLQNWEGLDSITRYYSFLGFTSLLAVCGFLCGLRFREDKGARTFLALSGAFVPALFCALGGLLYSLMPAAAFHNYPAYALWKAPSVLSYGLAQAASFVVVLPISFLTFGALAKRQSRKLTAAFLLACCFLLVPTRAPDAVGGLLLSLVCCLSLFEAKQLAGDSTMSATSEGSIARLILWGPAFLLTARSMSLYQVSDFLIGACLLSVALMIFVLAPCYIAKRDNAGVLQGISILPAAIGWSFVLTSIFDGFGFAHEYYLPCFGLPFAGLLFALGAFAVTPGGNYRSWGAFLVAATGFFQLVIHPSVVAALLCTTGGIVSFVYGYGIRQKTIFFCGVFAFVVALFWYLKEAALLLNTFGPWLSLAVLGGATIVGGSYIELHRRQVSDFFLKLRHTVQEMD